jgi:DNA-binding transcriptional LysR family regulator
VYEIMDLIAALRAFSRVAESGSFSAVARESGTTQPAISRQIAALEDHLGVRLLHRTTRSLALTEDGRDLLTHANRVLEAVDETVSSVGRGRASPSGLVRIGAAVSFGRLYIAPRVGRLLDRYPDLRLELLLADGLTDLVHEGLDVAVRIGDPPDSGLVARRIAAADITCVASRDYLERRGRPERPEDIAQHDCVIFTRRGGTEWVFHGPDGDVRVPVSGRFRTDSAEAVRQAVLAGLGIALMASWLFRDALLDGTAEELLPAWRPPPTPINAVYPSRRYLAPRTRAVIDFLVEEFRLDPLISAYGQA